MSKRRKNISAKKRLQNEVVSLAVTEIQNYSHAAAATNKQWSKGRYAVASSPNEDITDNLPRLHGLGRGEFMGNPVARGITSKIKANVVGYGLQMSPSVNAGVLDLSPEYAEAWQQKTRAEWELWAKSKDCDAGRRLTFGQLNGLALESSLVNGDVFAVLPRNTIIGQPYDLRIQLVEADRVRTPMSESGNKKAQGGILVGDFGESLAAFIHDDYEGTAFTKVPFFGDNGTPLLLQLAQDWERPDQVRGVTVFAPIMEVLANIDRYNKAELMANIISSFFTVVIETEKANFMGDGVPLGQEPQLDDGEVALGSGNIIQAREGEKFTPINPARTNSSFDAVMQNFLRLVGMGVGLPYEVLVAHFQSSYSAARGALQEAWKMYTMRRQWLIDSFNQPIYELWLTEAVAKGRIEAKGFFDDPLIKKAWCGANWIGPAQTSLNPAQEANANKINVAEGFDTIENIIQRTNGMNPTQVHETRVREHKARQEAGLIEGYEVIVNEE